MINVSVIVNNYLEVQGVNSVVDQFILNRELFEKQGIIIERIYDAKNYYKSIPLRIEQKNPEIRRSIKEKLKNTVFYNSYLGEWLIALLKYRYVGIRAHKNVLKCGVNEDVLVSQDIFMAYDYLRHSMNAKLIYMTHMFDNELEQFLMNYPKLRESAIEKHFRKIYQYVYCHADAVVTICEVAKNEIEKKNKCKSLNVIYNSIQGKTFRAETGESVKVRFVMASSLTKRKGIDLFCEALDILSPNIKMQCEFHIYGDGDYYNVLKNKKHNNVIMYGNVKQPYLNYVDKDVFLLTSRNETLPMSIIEAMSGGMPILATNVGAVDELVINEKNGFLVDVDAFSIAKGIEKMVKSKNDFCKMGKVSEQIYEKKFSNIVWVKEFSDVFNKIMRVE